MKILKKAYKVWVHSHIGEYPIFSIGDLTSVYAKTAGEAKRQCDWWDSKNKNGDEAKWIDIQCLRAKEDDKIEYNGEEIYRYQLPERQRRERRVIALNNLPENEMFYVQDSRDYVGNSVLWWGINGGGYVTQINKAHKYTKEEILKQFSNGRETDIIWLASHVEANIRQHVDIQGLVREHSY